nr:hypothetical protein HUO10_002828 [Paraburkholderia busanensis]
MTWQPQFLAQFLGYAAALSDGVAAGILWSIGALTLLTALIGLNTKTRTSRWFALLQTVALLALPALLLIGMVESMMPPG